MATKKGNSEVTEAKEAALEELKQMDRAAEFVNKEAIGIDFVPETWDDIIEKFDGEIITVSSSPWEVLKDKARLIGVPFMIADVAHYVGKFGDAVAVMLLTEDNHRYVINDGSSGIYRQVMDIVNRTGRKAGLKCPNGLRASTYTKTITDPFEGTTKDMEATTYYIA